MTLSASGLVAYRPDSRGVDQPGPAAVVAHGSGTVGVRQGGDQEGRGRAPRCRGLEDGGHLVEVPSAVGLPGHRAEPVRPAVGGREHPGQHMRLPQSALLRDMGRVPDHHTFLRVVEAGHVRPPEHVKEPLCGAGHGIRRAAGEVKGRVVDNRGCAAPCVLADAVRRISGEHGVDEFVVAFEERSRPRLVVLGNGPVLSPEAISTCGWPWRSSPTHRRMSSRLCGHCTTNRSSGPVRWWRPWWLCTADRTTAPGGCAPVP